MVQRRRNLPNHRLVNREAHPGEILGHGLAGDGQRVTVQQASVEQVLHDQWYAPCLIELRHHVPPAGTQIGDVWRAAADTVESVEFERHAGLVCDGKQVED